MWCAVPLTVKSRIFSHSLGQKETWKAKYLLEFSTDGINQYKAEIWMHGKKVQKVKWPIFPEPEWLDAPESRGSVGGSCGSKGSCNTGKCK